MIIKRLGQTFRSLAQLISIVLLFFCYKKTIESNKNNEKPTSTMDINSKFGKYQVSNNIKTWRNFLVINSFIIYCSFVTRKQ